MYNDSEIPIKCRTEFEYELYYELLKYFSCFIYLGIGLFMHVSILRNILFSEWKVFKKSSFFQIFVLDSIASTYLLTSDLFFTRMFMYIPPLCPIVSPYFWSPSIITKFVYATMNHCRFAKSIAQIFMVLNRMSCVLVPADYELIWKKLTPIVRFIVIILPFCGTWNIWISRVYVFRANGGFAMDYLKNITWAALSLFQSIFIFTALGFTVVCTSITLYKLIFLPDRIKSAEKSLCFTSIFISMCFLLVGATQIAFVTCTICRTYEYLFLMYMLSYWTFDVFNVGTALVMILTNKQIRTGVFNWIPEYKNGRASSISVVVN